jgi:hypothetical protein
VRRLTRLLSVARKLRSVMAENRNFSRDYLDLLKMKEIVDYMNKQNVRLDRIFSESIFLYSDLTTKDRHILMITCTTSITQTRSCSF